MKNDQGLDLSGLEKFEEASPSGEEVQAYEDSLKLVKEAMKTVLQEILIKLPDNSSHMVYVMGLKMSESVRGEVEVDFNTPSLDRKAELYPHVENCIKMQIQEYFNNRKKWYKRG